MSNALIRLFSRTRLSTALSIAMRAAAMGGKITFVLIAAIKMDPADLGKYGVVMSLATLVPGLVGIEAYQSMCRAITNGNATNSEKKIYTTFTLAAATAAFVVSFTVLTAMRWPASISFLCACVVASEHLGSELFRVLLSERRRVSALQSFSVRSGAWSLGLPLLSLVGLTPARWSLELVLAAWLAASVLGLAYVAALPIVYRPTRASAQDLGPWLATILPTSVTWLAIATVWRVIDAGPRIAAGIFLVGSDAGRFTFLSLLSATPSIVIKGLIEPMMFAELVTVDNVTARRRYFWILLMVSVVCAAGGALVLVVHSVLIRTALSTTDIWTFSLLTIGYVGLNLSQAPHFILYANHHDRLIFRVSAVATLASAPVICLGGAVGGLIGLAASVLFMASLLWAAKWWSVRLTVPAEFWPAHPSLFHTKH